MPQNFFSLLCCNYENSVLYLFKRFKLGRKQQTKGKTVKTQTIKIAIGTTAYVVGVFALFASPFFALWAFADHDFSIQYSAFGIIAFGGFLLSVFGYKVIKL